MTENKKNKRKRRVLAASCILAALIVAGSTFAWFTSKDEVVNKLSATNNYDVVAVEDFTPPSNWTPGQTVNKDVRVTNTGNVDAFVKATVTGDLVLTRLTTSVVSDADDAFKNAIVLSTGSTTQANPDTPATSADQVRAKQAGSRLVYSADTTHGMGDYKETDLGSNGVTLTTDQNKTIVTVDKDDTTHEYKPTTTGYYIFARSTTQNSTDGTTTKITYDGYYFDKDNSKYYDIEVTTPDTDNPYKIVAKLRQKETVTIANNKFQYSLSADNKTLTATYNGNTPAANDDDIIIKIGLTNIGTTGDTWTANVTENAATIGIADTTGNAAAFYYNKILAAGGTTSDVIDSVTLDENVKETAFLALDYNLKVTVQSAQVTTDDAKTTAVNAQNWAVKEATVSGTNVTWSERT
ncbi:MAG: hypothetical protein IJ192_06155 [Clostridia bacterium]|nr:hypothetical protein [Clostridia bacterium]